ncbi:N-acyl homoserine lactonase family protein [Sphingobium sp. H39-3-25]|uniref:N-acyl homoserine lactonase family protein n=1 Tax=Sphingobium arseniciresistens TaxID=3030834 RepID=UPI0023B8C505|nr:N-acyl homoserine lactonase family protein [Sphingobium arseniciresistens]
MYLPQGSVQPTADQRSRPQSGRPPRAKKRVRGSGGTHVNGWTAKAVVITSDPPTIFIECQSHQRLVSASRGAAMRMAILRNLAIYCAAALIFPPTVSAELRPKPAVSGPRLYVLDCGALATDMPEGFNLTRDEVASTIMANMCFLIVHPKGTFLWDTGVSDRFTGRPLGEFQPNKHVAVVRMRSLLGQLADIGYTPDQITYLSLSHAHWDHSGNGNLFSRTTTWLVSKAERDFMFGPNGYTREKQDWVGLETAKTIIIEDNHDVFGDGSVIIKSAPGHSPGHSVAVVKLPKTGNVILAGDLYHFKEEATLNRMPDAERKTQTPQSRAMVAALAKSLDAQVWIAHDLALSQRLLHEPAYYD